MASSRSSCPCLQCCVASGVGVAPPTVAPRAHPGCSRSVVIWSVSMTCAFRSDSISVQSVQSRSLRVLQLTRVWLLKAPPLRQPSPATAASGALRPSQSARGLLNHERWHDLQDAVGAATGRRLSAPSATGASQVPTAPPSPPTAPTDSPEVADQPTNTTTMPSTPSEVSSPRSPSPHQDRGTPTGSILASPGLS